MSVVVLSVWSAVDVTHSSTSDGYQHSATDQPNQLTSAVETMSVLDSELTVKVEVPTVSDNRSLTCCCHLKVF